MLPNKSLNKVGFSPNYNSNVVVFIPEIPIVDKVELFKPKTNFKLKIITEVFLDRLEKLFLV